MQKLENWLGLDMDNIELYLEEQRKLLLELTTMISALTMLTKKQIEMYKPPVEDVTIKGAVSVNTQKDVEVNNLDIVTEKLDDISSDITEAIKENKPTNEVVVSNIKDAINKEVEVRNLNNIENKLDTLNKTVADKDLSVQVTKEDIKLPRNAKDAIAVRLSDGKKFYEAIAGFTAAAQTLPFVISTETGKYVLAVANADGTPISGGTTETDTDNFLLESGDDFLLESGDQLLLESA